MRRAAADNEPRLSWLGGLKDPFLLPEKREELMRLAWEWLEIGKFAVRS